MWKTLLAAGAAGLLAAGPAAAQFDAPFHATPGQPQPPPRVVPAVAAAPEPKPGENLFEILPAGAASESFLPCPAGDPGAAACGGACAPAPALWASAEFLLWATRSVSVPPVVTTASPALGPGAAGLVGQPGTVPVFGGRSLLGSLRPGFRTELGTWLDPRTAVSARFFFLAQHSEGVAGGSDGFTVVNAPQVVNVLGVPVQIPAYVGFPLLTLGTVSASAHTNFLGGDANLRRALANDPGLRAELLAGYRYLHLGDELNAAFDVAPALLPGLARVSGADGVRSRNDFHGAQVGLAAGGRSGRWGLDVQSTLALGVTVSEVDFDRTRTVGLLGLAPFPFGGGACGGRSSVFAVVPEVGVKLGYQAGEHLRLTAGYDFLYWSRVRRAQDLYDLGGTLRGGGTDVWAQGLSLGLDLRY